jgi:hypothetical protein
MKIMKAETQIKYSKTRLSNIYFHDFTACEYMPCISAFRLSYFSLVNVSLIPQKAIKAKKTGIRVSQYGNLILILARYPTGKAKKLTTKKAIKAILPVTLMYDFSLPIFDRDSNNNAESAPEIHAFETAASIEAIQRYIKLGLTAKRNIAPKLMHNPNITMFFRPTISAKKPLGISHAIATIEKIT